MVHLLVALMRALGIKLDWQRLLDGAVKSGRLRAIDRAQSALQLRHLLRVLGLSQSRYHAWRRSELRCELADVVSCPSSSPHRRTRDEIQRMREMVESPDFRHVPEKLVAFYVEEHNSRLPQSAFRGQTPDEMYFGTGEGVPDDLERQRAIAK